MVKTTYYCDLCGEELPAGFTPMTGGGNDTPQKVLRCTEICSKCLAAYSALDKAAVLRDAIISARKKAGCKSVNAPPPETVSFAGRESAAKKAAWDRLRRYRTVNGLGAYSKVVEASEGRLTDYDVRGMAQGEKVKPALWKVLAETMDKLEKEGT